MKRYAGILAMIATLSLAAGCGPSEHPAKSEKTTADQHEAPSEAATNLPPVSALIGRRVADYGAWKPVFDEHMQARKEASCLGHYLKQGIDEADMIYVYCLATDAEKLRGFLSNADVAAAMKNAGAKGDPEITLMKPISRNLVPEQELPGIILMFAVEDYASWRVAYDAFEDFRRNSGIIGQAVSQEFGNPNQLIVYHQANDVPALRAFVDSAELRDMMQRAGAVGDPVIRFIKVVGFSRY